VCWGDQSRGQLEALLGPFKREIFWAKLGRASVSNSNMAIAVDWGLENIMTGFRILLF